MDRHLLDTIDAERYPPEARTCPRCGTTDDLRFAGPCRACAQHLRADLAREGRAATAQYDPAMHVTPNAVALKDD